MEPVPGQREEETEKKLINLLRGWPSTHVLPADLLKTASAKVLSDPDIFVPGLQYGPEPGYQPLREELARFLSSYYDTEPDAERLCITGGASQSMACLLQSFTEPVYTKAVWAVAPCYYLACPIFEDSGFRGRLRAVPEDSEGVDLDFLEKGLRSFQEELDPDERPVYKDPNLRKIYRHVIYVVPSSANPSGKTMTLRRREGLVRLAREYDCLVICDDVYDFLQWPVSSSVSDPLSSSSSISTTVPPLPRTKPLPRLADIDRALGPSKHDAARPDGRWFGHAISNGSFSKIVAPGVRTGWVEGTRDFALGTAQTGSTGSGGAPSQLSATLVCEVMRRGDLARHIDAVCRPGLQRRHGLLMRAVHEQLDRFGIEVLDGNLGGQGEGAGQPATYGGYFVWITFPRGPAAKDITERAMRDENLIVPPGSMFEVKRDEETARFEKSIRLCFSWEDEEDLVEGVARLGRVVQSLWEGKPEEASQEGKASGHKTLAAFF
ncbi:PLP-dependent transferase [Cryphonectria parasitica EP155]|uniref:PLP-dependent transferase n=1 Tax=Cryphonectria parasitica (strain ATCC 38755 / EP155) TaxID=660469 RepID=A0A9P4Y7I4_CRYP1|nr:PLP-dependent transferase [Cryphonectria parasitica EP155]KAF3767520.1 PLP-dependent transferase [Cryphonectria parasitica EP155]